MALGSLLSYSALTTKIRAMKSNLLSESQFEELSHLTTVSDALAYLQKTPAYDELFSELQPSDVHRGQIEWLLNFSTYEDFSKIYSFAKKKQRKYLNLYFMRYEIMNLKRYIRAILDPRQTTFVSVVENDFEKHSSLNTKKLAESADMNEFVEGLKGTMYHNCLHKVHSNFDNPSLFDYEMALDLFYFSTIWDKKDKLFSKSERTYIINSYGSRIDLLNILWIYRCKSYYTVPSSKMYSLLLPIYHKLKKAEVKSMVEADSAAQVLTIAETTYYGKRYGFNTGLTLQEQCNAIIDKIINKDFKQAPYSFACINAYFHLKNSESAKIITALECIRYGYSSERVLQYVKRKGSGV